MSSKDEAIRTVCAHAEVVRVQGLDQLRREIAAVILDLHSAPNGQAKDAARAKLTDLAAHEGRLRSATPAAIQTMAQGALVE